MLMTYWTLYFLLPNFLLKKRIASFILIFIVSLVFAGLLEQAILVSFFHPLFNPVNKNSTVYWNINTIVRIILIINSTVIVAATIKVMKLWYQNQQRLQLAEREQLVSEIKYLQTQMQPHFFFNTLNNLYGLILKRSDVAAEVVLKLADLMRYMVYEANKSAVSLEKEINHIQNYIELEKIRYPDGFDIFFTSKGDTRHQLIAPLLLFPFVENAFKHGLSESIESSWINLNINLERKHLQFRIENSLAERKPDADMEGLGLQNIQRRLELLFTGNYNLLIKQQERSYLVELNINLETYYDN